MKHKLIEILTQWNINKHNYC